MSNDLNLFLRAIRFPEVDHSYLILLWKLKTCWTNWVKHTLNLSMFVLKKLCHLSKTQHPLTQTLNTPIPTPNHLYSNKHTPPLTMTHLHSLQTHTPHTHSPTPTHSHTPPHTQWQGLVANSAQFVYAFECANLNFMVNRLTRYIFWFIKRRYFFLFIYTAFYHFNGLTKTHC